jgi:hypothetical protein
MCNPTASAIRPTDQRQDGAADDGHAQKRRCCRCWRGGAFQRQREDGREHDRIEQPDRQGGIGCGAAIASGSRVRQSSAAPSARTGQQTMGRDLRGSPVNRLPMKRPTMAPSQYSGPAACRHPPELTSEHARLMQEVDHHAADRNLGADIEEDRGGPEQRPTRLQRRPVRRCLDFGHRQSARPASLSRSAQPTTRMQPSAAAMTAAISKNE